MYAKYTKIFVFNETPALKKKTTYTQKPVFLTTYIKEF